MFVRKSEHMETTNRIIGFDLARAYALFGMFIVNFNTVFGSHTNHDGLSGFLNLFNGNSSTLFVILAGMGVALMSNREQYHEMEKKNIKSIVLKRSWFLFVIGLLLYTWWPADILHFYGGYMHVAAFLLFVPKRWYIISAVLAIVIWHILLLIIPFENGWDFNTLLYTDFWSISGFIRNTFYNGWNPIFPWIAYFFLGMWLGRLNWNDKLAKIKVFAIAELVYLATEGLRCLAAHAQLSPDINMYLTADYLPPTLPFLLSTASLSCVILVFTFWIGEKIHHTRFASVLANTGRMTLTHYILSLTLAMIVLALLSGKTYTGDITDQSPLSPTVILMYSICYFAAAVLFSTLWSARFKNGPFEQVMRLISGEHFK
jgi:uncharacterized protein